MLSREGGLLFSLPLAPLPAEPCCLRPLPCLPPPGVGLGKPGCSMAQPDCSEAVLDLLMGQAAKIGRGCQAPSPVLMAEPCASPISPFVL